MSLVTFELLITMRNIFTSFRCSYHQKYMLQHHPWLLESLDINPGEQLISSHVAARINGYIGGYGKVQDFNAEGPKLGLNEKMVEYVARKMTSKV